MRLNDIGEFPLIERLKVLLPEPPGSVLAGIGDDCAVLDAGDDRALLFAADACVEGTHFFTESPQIGWKALTSNLSDIAAMGGTPIAALAVLAARPDVEVRIIDEIYGDMARAARHYGVPIVGGDTVSTSGPLAVAVSVLGEVHKDRVVLRSGASPGQALVVVGWLGTAYAGCELYRTRREMWDMSRAIATHRPTLEYTERLAFVTASLMRGQTVRPRLQDSQATHRLDLEFHEPLAHLAAGRALAETGAVTAMIDVSDGLAGDARKLAEASCVGLRIHLGDLPLAPDLLTCFGDDQAPFLALCGGEDFALLFTVPKSALPVVTRALEAEYYLPSVVGETTDEPGRHTVVLPGGEEEDLSSTASWDHFSR